MPFFFSFLNCHLVTEGDVVKYGTDLWPGMKKKLLDTPMNTHAPVLENVICDYPSFLSCFPSALESISLILLLPLLKIFKLWALCVPHLESSTGPSSLTVGIFS